MSIRSTPPTPHLDDVALLRFIDHEGSTDEQVRWNAHLRQCGACREEADQLRGQSDIIGRWLAAADVDPGAVATPTPTPAAAPDGMRLGRRGLQAPWRGAVHRPWLRAAVLVLLLAAPLAAFPGVREWVADRVTGGAWVAPTAPRATAAPDEVASAPRIRFVPAPGTFAVVLDAGQAQGSLSVWRVVDGDEAVLDVTGTGPLPEPVVAERILRIGNTAAATASYSLGLPRGVEALSVTIGGSVVQLGAHDLDRGTIIPLDRT